MLEAIANGLKLITVKEAIFFAGSDTKQIILVTLFNVLLVHAIATNWKRRGGLEVIVLCCFFVTWIMLEITGVAGVGTLLAAAAGG